MGTVDSSMKEECKTHLVFLLILAQICQEPSQNLRAPKLEPLTQHSDAIPIG